MTTTDSEEKPGFQFAAGSTSALGLTGSFLVVTTAFVLHFLLVYAPLQGVELERYLQAYLTADTGAALEAGGLVSAPALPRFLVSAAWHLGGGTITLIRIVSLLLHVFAVALSFRLLWIWLGRQESIILPLLGGMLVAVSPASVAVISQADGWGILLAVDLFMAACCLYLTGNQRSNGEAWGRIALCCCCSAAAAAACPLMAVGPVVILLMDRLRVKEGHSRVPSGDWCFPGTILASGLAVLTVMYVGGSSFDIELPAQFYAATIGGGLCVCRLLEFVPGMRVRRAAVLVLALLLPAGAVVSFMSSLACADPVSRLEKLSSNGADAETQRRLALQYYEKSLRQDNPEAGRMLAAQSAAAWPAGTASGPQLPWETLLRARALTESGSREEAANMIMPVLEEVPFKKTGIAAARLRASVLEGTDASGSATLFAFAAGSDAGFTDEELLAYARALVYLGDIEKAREMLSRLPEYEKDSPGGILHRGVVDASNNARTLQESYRRKISRNPADISAYVDLAKGSLLSGNSLRAFYFLEMALRRDSGNMEAWEHLGLVFARQNQAADFIGRWGAGKESASQAWFSLARRAAQAGIWNAAFEYVKGVAAAGMPSAEEYVAVFAIEAKREDVAREWIARAIETHPDSYSPRLLQADIALAGNAPDEARAFLEEARRLQAPEEELRKRQDRLPGGPPASSVTGEPFEPVRTYIQ